MGKLFGALVLLLFVTQDVSLDGLLSDDSRVRRAGVVRLKESLSPQSARSLLERFESLPPALKTMLVRVLGSGGPWMPGVVRSLDGPSGTQSAARRILHTALWNRARADDPLPLLDELQIFGDGVEFAFPGTWPGDVSVGEFLDRINLAASPSLPFVLDPLLDEAQIAPIATPPPPGPARMVIDLVLMERGLGVRRFESLLLVTEGGASCHGLSAHDEEFDQAVLDRIVDALVREDTAPASRRAALEALAALGIPGLLEGYLDETILSHPESADFLLASATLRRLALRLGAAGDTRSLSMLLSFLERDGPPGRKRALADLAGLVPAELLDRASGTLDEPGLLLRALCSAGWTDEERLSFVRSHLTSGDRDRREAGLCAALPALHRSPDLVKALLVGIAGWKVGDRRLEALLDRCVAAAGCLWGDRDLAQLIRGGAGAVGAIEAAADRGGTASLDALAERLARPNEGRLLLLVIALHRCCTRLGTDVLEAVSASGRRLGAIASAGIDLVLGGDGEKSRAAAEKLVEEIVTGGPSSTAAVELMALVDGSALDDVFGFLLARMPAESTAWPPGLRTAIIRSVCEANRRDSTAAARLRYSLGDHPGRENDALLDRALRNLSAARKPGSFAIEVRFGLFARIE